MDRQARTGFLKGFHADLEIAVDASTYVVDGNAFFDGLVLRINRDPHVFADAPFGVAFVPFEVEQAVFLAPCAPVAGKRSGPGMLGVPHVADKEATRDKRPVDVLVQAFVEAWLLNPGYQVKDVPVVEGVNVTVGVFEGVKVGVMVSVGVLVLVGVEVGVFDGVGVAEGVGVNDGVNVAVGVIEGDGVGLAKNEKPPCLSQAVSERVIIKTMPTSDK